MRLFGFQGNIANAELELIEINFGAELEVTLTMSLKAIQAASKLH